ncbi:hypothetical protein Tco_1449988 [Tanacetum coccineum]
MISHFLIKGVFSVSQEKHGGEQLDFDVDSVIDDHDNTIPYHQYQLNNEIESVLTDVSSVIPGEIFVITILDDLRSQLAGHIKTNEEQSFDNDSLKAELERYQNNLLNKVVTELLQSYGQPVQTVPMLSKRPTFSTKDLHKSALGHRNPLYLKSAQLCRPTLYLGDVIVDPVHTPFRVYDSEETLVQAEVSRTKMLERMKDPLCKVSSKPINYAKLNSLYDTFVPQKQLSSEQVYWLPANEVASYNCNQSKPITTFVRTRPAKSQVNTQLKMLKACFPEFDKVVKDRTTPSYITNGEWRFEHTKKCFVEEIISFSEKLKTHVKGIEDNVFKEVSEYMKIFDELDKEYDQCVIDKKSLEIENKNLLIQNECLLAESVSKDICSVVLISNIAVESRSNCVKEHSINLELEAEILKMKQLLVEKEKRRSFIETKYQELELKFQKYKECFKNPQVCNNSSSPELDVFFEINKLKDQLQGKDELIKKLKAQIGNMNEVSADPNLSTLEFQALETKNTQLKEELTAVRIKNDSLRDENLSIKKRYQDLYQSKAESNRNVSSRAVVPEKPKVLAPGLYAMMPKYIPPQKRNNKEANTPLPKEREVASTKLPHMIAPGSSRYSSNDMVHNHYLEEAKKQTHEIGKNSKTSVIPSARSQSTVNGSKPKPRINNQKSRNWPASKTSYVTTKTVPIAKDSRNSRNFSDSKHFVCSTCQKCVFNANHDHCVTKYLNEVNSRAKKPTGKIFKTAGLRWVPTGKIFNTSTTKVDSEPTNGSDEDITNQYEYKQTLDVSAGTPNLSAGLRPNSMAPGHNGAGPEIKNLQSGQIGFGLNLLLHDLGFMYVIGYQKLHGNVSSHIPRDIFLKFDSAVDV